MLQKWNKKTKKQTWNNRSTKQTNTSRFSVGIWQSMSLKQRPKSPPKKINKCSFKHTKKINFNIFHVIWNLHSVQFNLISNIWRQITATVTSKHFILQYYRENRNNPQSKHLATVGREGPLLIGKTSDRTRLTEERPSVIIAIAETNWHDKYTWCV